MEMYFVGVGVLLQLSHNTKKRWNSNRHLVWLLEIWEKPIWTTLLWNLIPVIKSIFTIFPMYIFKESWNVQIPIHIQKPEHALEHKYVKITKGWFPDRENGEIDDLALYVNETELYDLTMQLMHIVREVIICLTMCVHAEEKSRKKENGDQLVMPMPLMEYDDNWKI